MHHGPELFAAGHAAESRLARIDVRVKLILALASVIAVVISSRTALPAAIFACALAAMVWAGVPLRHVPRRLAGPLGLAAVVCVLRAFMTGATAWFTFDIGLWRLTVTREGALDGTLVGLRVLASVTVILLLCAVTPTHRLFAALRWARLPRTLIEVAMLMYRYIFTLFSESHAVLTAQRVRLGHATLRRAVLSMGSLAGLVILRSLDQADKTHEAMRARGYQGRLPLPGLPPIVRGELVMMLVGIAAIGLAYWAGERWLP